VHYKDYTRREVIGRFGAAVLTSSVVGILPTEATAEVVSQAKRWRIERYSIGWNTRTNVGRVALYLETPDPTFKPPSNPVLIKVGSLSDMPGYTEILKQTPVYYTPGGWIHTGTEEI
jgi:hypothetical protein